MKKENQTFSILRVAKAMWLFFGILTVVILIAPLIMGIEDKKVFPAQHEKEIKKWEEKVEKNCNPPCVSEIKEQPKLLLLREWKQKELENAKKKKYSDIIIKSLEDELNAKTKFYCKDGECSQFDPCKIVVENCKFTESTLSNIKNENPPSIFHYYGKVFGYVDEFILKHFTAFMFFTILIILSSILIEVRKLKK